MVAKILMLLVFAVVMFILIKIALRMWNSAEKLDMKSKVKSILNVVDVEAETKKVDVKKVNKARQNVEAFKNMTKEV